MKVHTTNAGGFTLIETTIAMVVMMVVGLGATSLFLYSIRNNSGGDDRSQALAIAQQRLELLRELPYNDPELALGQRTTTVILQDVETSNNSASYAGNGGAETFAAAAASGGGNRDDMIAPGKPGKGNPTPTPTPNASPTPGGGGGSGGGGGGGGNDDDTYKVVLDVEGLPAGAATPTQKRITIRVTPENGYGTNSWINRNPVVIVLLRSSPANGPYKL